MAADLTLGPFRLGHQLGKGAHAQVFRAEHTETGRPVAIKVLASDARGAAKALEREVQAVAALAHPGIVAVYDTGLVAPGDRGLVDQEAPSLRAGARWVALELATHGALSDQPPKHFHTVRQILIQVLQALAHAHARDVIHRDLKPANVLRSGRRMKLADFGLAWAMGQRHGPRVAGTPAYMAPEQVRGEAEHIGPWTDLYAVGCVAWELTTGAPPFDGDAEAVMELHQTEEAPRFEPVMDVPRDFEVWVRRLLTKAPHLRDDHAALAAAALADLELPLLGRPRRPAAPSSQPEAATWADSLTQEADPPPESSAPIEVTHVLPWRLPREEWRLAERSRPPVWLLGSSLGLYTLRAAPVVGRFSERDQLWAALREAAAEQHPVAVCVHGPSGLGRTALGRWLSTAVAEGGHGSTLAIAGEGPDACWAEVQKARERGMVLIWVDDPTPAIADQWVDRVLDASLADQPLLLVLTAEEAPLGAGSIRLRPLPDRHVSSLCRQVAGVSPSLGDALSRRVGGVPGDALRLLRALVENDALVHGPDGFRARGTLRRLPRTHAQHAAHEVARVAAEVHDLRSVAIAALLRGRVGLGTWRKMCQHCGVEPSVDAFQPLLDAELVRWTGRWRFTGAVADGVLAQLPDDEVTYLAARIANGLADSPEAYHDRELQAELMLRAGRPDRAFTLASQTHESRVTERTVWVADRASARLDIDPYDPRAVWLDLWRLQQTGRAHDGASNLKRALARLEPLRGEARQMALSLVANVARMAGRVSLALELVDEALAVRPQSILLRKRSVYLEELGRMDEAERCADEALQLAYEENDAIGLPRVLNNVADWHRVRGRLDEAERGFRAALEAWETVPGPFVHRAVVLENLVLVLGLRGQWREATEEMEDLVTTTMEREGGRIRRVTFFSTLALCAAHAGRADLVRDAVVRMELEPPWRIRHMGTEGLSQMIVAAEQLSDPALARRLVGVVRRAGPEAFAKAVEMARHGFFGDR